MPARSQQVASPARPAQGRAQSGLVNLMQSDQQPARPFAAESSGSQSASGVLSGMLSPTIMAGAHPPARSERKDRTAPQHVIPTSPTSPKGSQQGAGEQSRLDQSAASMKSAPRGGPSPRAATRNNVSPRARSPTSPGSSVQMRVRADSSPHNRTPRDSPTSSPLRTPREEELRRAGQRRTSSPSLGSPRPKPGSPGGASGQCHVRVMVRVRPFTAGEVEAAAHGAYIQSVVDMPRTDQVQLLDPDRDYTPKAAFNFDLVMWSCTQQRSPCGFASQETVYDETGALALEAGWEGMNSCIFAYGQTGSGKTHTMMGDPGQIAADRGCEDSALGVIPRLCRQMFADIAQQEQESSTTFGIRKSVEVSVSFIEIYNERCYDLLAGAEGSTPALMGSQVQRMESSTASRVMRPEGSPVSVERPASGHQRGRSMDSSSPVADDRRALASTWSKSLRGGTGDGSASPHTEHGRPQWTKFTRHATTKKAGQQEVEAQPLCVREHPVDGPVVVGATVHVPRSYHEVMDLINYGNRERSTAATKLNDRSSRSHAMFRLTLRQVSYLERERVGIGVPRVDTSERRANINLVDLAGSENTKRSGASGATMVEAQKINLSLTTLRRVIDALIEQKSQQVIPYRDSTLTWLLRQNLGGNSKCFMLATVSPHRSNLHESQRTLEYAMRARAIVNVVTVNEDETAKMLRELEKRLEQHKQQSATAEERADLAMAEREKQELMQRLEAMEAEKNQFREEMDRLRNAKTADMLRVAAQKRHQRQLSEVESELSVKEFAYQDVNRKLSEAGYADIGEVLADLEQLRVSREREHREREGARQRHAGELRSLREEHERERQGLEAAWQARLASTKASSDDRQLQIEKLNASYEALLAEARSQAAAAREQEAAMRKELELTRESTQEQLEEAERRTRRAEEEAHNARRKGEEEANRVAARALDKLQRDHSVALLTLRKELERAKQQLRDEKERSAERMRSVQDSELRLQKELIELRAQTVNQRQELQRKELASTEISSREQQLMRQIEGHEEDLRREAAGHAATREELQRALASEEKGRGEAALERDQVRADADRSAQEVARLRDELDAQEATFRRAYRGVTEFLDFVHRETVPADWTMADVRKIFSEFAAYRRAMVSYKPTRQPSPYNSPTGHVPPPALADRHSHGGSGRSERPHPTPRQLYSAADKESLRVAPRGAEANGGQGQRKDGSGPGPAPRPAPAAGRGGDRRQVHPYPARGHFAASPPAPGGHPRDRHAPARTRRSGSQCGADTVPAKHAAARSATAAASVRSGSHQGGSGEHRGVPAASQRAPSRSSKGPQRSPPSAARGTVGLDVVAAF